MHEHISPLLGEHPCIVLYCIVLIALSRCNRVFTRRLRFRVAIVCLHEGFACATPTPCTAMKIRKGDREGPNRVESEV